MLTGLRDTDRQVLRYVDDEELFVVCSINRKMWFHVCDDGFLRRRLSSRYPEIEKFKSDKNETWKRFFRKVIHYVSLLKRKFKYEYRSGNFENQFYLLNHFIRDNLLMQAVVENEFDVIKYAVENGANVRGWDDHVLKWSCSEGYFDIVKYLVENGADVRASYNSSLQSASFTAILKS